MTTAGDELSNTKENLASAITDELRSAYAGRARIRDVEAKLGRFMIAQFAPDLLICDRCNPKTYSTARGGQQPSLSTTNRAPKTK